MSMAINMNDLNPTPTLASHTKRPLNTRKIEWKRLPEYKIFEGGKRYILRSMEDRESEFEAVAKLWRNHASYLFGSPYEFVLDPDTYPTIFSTSDQFMQKDWFMEVIEHDEAIVGATLLNRDVKNMAIEWSPVIISKSCYSKSLCEAVYQFIEQSIEKAGAEYVFALVPSFERAMQELLLTLKFKIRGVIPGLLLTWASENSYCRTSIVYMDKFYNDGDTLVVPPNEVVPAAEPFIEE